jgi:hypothetical protein
VRAEIGTGFFCHFREHLDIDSFNKTLRNTYPPCARYYSKGFPSSGCWVKALMKEPNCRQGDEAGDRVTIMARDKTQDEGSSSSEK